MNLSTCASARQNLGGGQWQPSLVVFQNKIKKKMNFRNPVNLNS